MIRAGTSHPALFSTPPPSLSDKSLSGLWMQNPEPSLCGSVLRTDCGAGTGVRSCCGQAGAPTPCCKEPCGRLPETRPHPCTRGASPGLGEGALEAVPEPAKLLAVLRATKCWATTVPRPPAPPAALPCPSTTPVSPRLALQLKQCPRRQAGSPLCAGRAGPRGGPQASLSRVVLWLLPQR